MYQLVSVDIGDETLFAYYNDQSGDLGVLGYDRIARLTEDELRADTEERHILVRRIVTNWATG